MKDGYSIEQVNRMEQADFIDIFGGIYEHSPWVADGTWHARPFADIDVLARAMWKTVERATRDERLTLLKMHPKLGLKKKMTEVSQTEQSSAGLTTASTTQVEELSELNERYEKKFGFPFVIAVKNLNVQTIIDRCRNRVLNDTDAEFEESLNQVFRIAGFRLADLVTE